MIPLLLLLALQQPPPTGQIEVEGGARVTRVTTVRAKIRITSEGAGGLQMSIASDPSASPVWTPVQETAVLELPAGDGEKRVLLRLRDSKGTESPPAVAVIRLDTMPPVAKVEAPERTEEGAVRIVCDVPDAVALQHAESLDRWSSWEPYATPKILPLSKGPGKKVVFVRFRDEAGNESLPGRVVVEAVPEAALDARAGIRSLLVDLRKVSPSSLRLHVLIEGRGLVDTRIQLEGEELQPREPSRKEYRFSLPMLDAPRRLIVTSWDAAGGEHRGEAVVQASEALPEPATGDAESAAGPEWAVSVLAGVLPSGVGFDASMASGYRKIDKGPMALIRVEAQRMLAGPLFVKGAFEWGGGGDVSVLSAGVDGGVDLPLGNWAGLEFASTLGVGVFYSTLDVDQSGFTDFRGGPGLRVMGGLRTHLTDSLWLDVVADWRFVRYPTKDDVLRGDEKAEMSGAALLLGLSWRF